MNLREVGNDRPVESRHHLIFVCVLVAWGIDVAAVIGLETWNIVTQHAGVVLSTDNH